MKNPKTLTHDELADIVADIQATLWLEAVDPCDAEKGIRTNPDKEWMTETIEVVAFILSERGLRPRLAGPYREDSLSYKDIISELRTADAHLQRAMSVLEKENLSIEGLNQQMLDARKHTMKSIQHLIGYGNSGRILE